MENFPALRTWLLLMSSGYVIFFRLTSKLTPPYLDIVIFEIKPPLGGTKAIAKRFHLNFDIEDEDNLWFRTPHRRSQNLRFEARVAFDIFDLPGFAERVAWLSST